VTYFITEKTMCFVPFRRQGKPTSIDLDKVNDCVSSDFWNDW